MRLFFFCHWLSFARLPTGVIDVDITEKKRGSVNIENCNYGQQIGEKLGLDKACQYNYKKKVHGGDVDI